MEVGMAGVDVHDAVSTGVVVATDAVLLNVFPRRLVDRDIVELQPLVGQRAVDVRPVVAGRGLALVHQHRM